MKFPSFRRKAITGTPAVLDMLADRQYRPWPALGGTNASLARRQIQAAFSTAQSADYAWMYTNSPAVRTVVDLIARNVGQLDMRLFEEIDEAERVARPEHAAALSLRYPSSSQTRDQFVRAIMSDYLVFNNAYGLKFRDGGTGRLVIKPIPAHRVSILGQSMFDPEAYKITNHQTGDFVIVEDPTDMIHWRGWNPDDPRVGLSPLETLRDVVAEDAALQTAVVELAKSGLAGAFYVYRPLEAPELSQDARDRAEEDVANRLGDIYHKPPFMEEGSELRQLGVSPRDAEMLSVRRWALEQICGLYGVHPASVGVGDKVEEAQQILLENVLPTYCEAFTRQLDLSVLIDEYGETEFCFEFNLDEKLMGNDRLKAITSAIGAPPLTRNEGRAMLNKKPVKGGDEPITPLNVLVGDPTKPPKPSVDVMPIQDPNKPSQDGDHREDDPKYVDRDLSRGQALVGKRGPETVQLPASTKALPEGFEISVPLWEHRYKEDFNRQQRYVDEAVRVVSRMYDRQSAALRHKSGGEMDLDRWDREHAQDLFALLASVVEREGGTYAARLAGDDFDMRFVQNYLKSQAEGAAEAMNRTTLQDIETVGLVEAFDRIENERSDRLATSLAVRAASFARITAAERFAPNPERRLKVWIADTDRHMNFNGVHVPLNEDWGGISPGSLPNCKCSISIV